MKKQVQLSSTQQDSIQGSTASISYDISPTIKGYMSLSEAYDFLNKALFDNTLPDCLLTLQRKANSFGYYSHKRFKNSIDNSITDEIALNPMHFDKPVNEVLSTLAHEMCHLWQAHKGINYSLQNHNTEWSSKMLEIGLQPVVTLSRRNATHTIQANGLFDRKIQDIKDKTLLYQDQVINKQQTKAKRESKSKYTCNSCNLNVWGKPGIRILCMNCNLQLK